MNVFKRASNAVNLEIISSESGGLFLFIFEESSILKKRVFWRIEYFEESSRAWRGPNWQKNWRNINGTFIRQVSQVWLQIMSDWPQMGQILDFFRSYSSTFWLVHLDLSHLRRIWRTLGPNLTSPWVTVLQLAGQFKVTLHEWCR